MTTAPLALLEGPFAELRPPLASDEAVLEADRCLGCGGRHAPAPCVVACPAEVDVPTFVEAIARGDLDEAATTIFAENLLGGSCARVCPAEVLCEGACVLIHEGRRPVEIARLQRFAADSALENGVSLRSRATPTNGRRVAVVGAGPAGLACAGELAARGYSVAVYDERDEAGGLVRYAIAPYRQLREPLPAELRLLEDLGVELRLGERVDAALLAQLERDADAVFLGVGLGADLDPDLPGEELPGVWRSLEFVEALKCQRPPHVSSRVAVVGGGNTAIDVAREAVRLGADDVVLVYRRTKAEMPAYAHEVEEARDEGVRFEWLSAPVRILGCGRVSALECQRMALGEPDASGRARPEPVPGSQFLLPVDTVVLAIGQAPRREFLANVVDLELAGGRVAVDAATGCTGNPKVFAGGDAVNGGATAVEAVAHGKRAARGIDALLGGAT
jgi:dihydropyrimidine dehydrogenase (NAD+) subunit PreT